MIEGSSYFQRFVRECKAMSPHIKFVPIRHGYYRIYWVGAGERAYMHEVYKYMPNRGYQLEFKDLNLVSERYYQEFEEQIKYTRLLKNYVEGYTDAIERMRTRVYMFKNDKAFRTEACKAYKQVKIR